jgi:hypothetical protein
VQSPAYTVVVCGIRRIRRCPAEHRLCKGVGCETTHLLLRSRHRLRPLRDLGMRSGGWCMFPGMRADRGVSPR